MRILGLTGGIAMGKSTAAKMLRRLRLPLHDADAAVHRLYARGGAAVKPVAALFPEALVEGAIDRGRLWQALQRDPSGFGRLERIVHPLVRRESRRFLARQSRERRPLVVLDIPLLFESGGERLCDYVVVVSAPAFLQRQRALRRGGLTPARLDQILARQTPDRVKRRCADAVIPTGLGRGFALARLERALRKARHAPARAWPPRIRPGRRQRAA